jgi:hypothetical protein
MNNLCGVAQVWPPSCPSVATLPERDLLATRPHPIRRTCVNVMESRKARRLAPAVATLALV